MTITREIRKTIFQKIPGFKVLTWAEIPGIEKPQLLGSRFFDSEEEAQAYIEYCEKAAQASKKDFGYSGQDFHFSLF